MTIGQTYLVQTASLSRESFHRLRHRAEEMARRLHRETGEAIYICPVRDGVTVTRPDRPAIGGVE